jgi:acyl-CoA thioesterase
MVTTPGTVTPEQVAAIMLREDRASRSLGIELVDIGLGTATVAMTLRDDMANGYGIAHGGLVAALADTAFALACNSYGEVTVAAGFSVEFLEPGHTGDRLVAEAAVVARRGRSGVYDVVVRREDTVLATFRGKSRSLGQPFSAE